MKYSHAKMVRATLATRRMMNHQCGTWSQIECHHAPSMEEKNMRDGRRERGKADAVGHCEECAQVERTILLVGLDVEVEVGVYDAGDVVALPGGCEEAIGEDGEGFGVVEVEPVRSGRDDIHDERKASRDIGSGKPRAGQGAAEADGADAEAMEARTELLGKDGAREDPAHPGEGGEHGEEVAWENVVGKATEEGHHEELVPSHATFGATFFLVQGSACR
ncbi:hypothetical protein C4D60_Mb03t11790 [Musa balbisiana]|uniref:Uncharacterized protein n=1 Tax=Musa balbisiana TaxID=52838 RepID=A0A4S8J982_MUSBA|nr:hypothetical protein C4D60_Mb03t11790 [Musa balbisiana]